MTTCTLNCRDRLAAEADTSLGLTPAGDLEQSIEESGPLGGRARHDGRCTVCSCHLARRAMARSVCAMRRLSWAISSRSAVSPAGVRLTQVRGRLPS